MTEVVERVPFQTVRNLLRMGEVLPFSVLDPQGRLLLNAGQRLVDDAQFDALVDRGAWADRALVEAERLRQLQAEAEGKNWAPATLMPSRFDHWERSLWLYDKISRGLARGEINGGAIPPLWNTLKAQIDTDPDAALYLCLRYSERRFALYAQHHAVHCAVVSLLAARTLGWSAEAIDALGCAALTMNIAMLELQAQLAEQDDPPSARQRERIQAHPEAGVALLRKAGVTDALWLDTVLYHHHNPEGTGYPKGLKGPAPETARLLRMADVYMAKISPRAKRPAMTPVMAMRQLFQQNPKDVLAGAMVKAMGVHPPGALVELQSGEIAVVVHRPASGTQPVVATLSDRQGRPIADTHRRDCTQAEFAIKSPLEDTRRFPRVLPERVYGFIAP